MPSMILSSDQLPDYTNRKEYFEPLGNHKRHIEGDNGVARPKKGRNGKNLLSRHVSRINYKNAVAGNARAVRVGSEEPAYMSQCS